MTHRILLLGTTTGYQTRSFGEAAARLGVELLFATDRCHVLEDPWRDNAVPVKFYAEDESVKAILEAATARPIDGILALGDRPTVVAALAARALGSTREFRRGCTGEQQQAAGPGAAPDSRAAVPVVSFPDARELADWAPTGVRLSLCRQAAGVVGESRRDESQRSR